jgi:outer membrane receptor protein involved in Fe transport
MHLNRTPVGALLLCTLVSLAHGQAVTGTPSTAKDPNAPLQLAAVEVTENRVDGLINKGLLPVEIDAPLPYNIITRQEIERMGATNIEEVFRNTNEITTYSTPNQEASVVQIVGSSSLSSNLQMRGFDAQQTTVLINGRRIARSSFPNLVGASSGDLTRIPVGAIERIEILPTSGSAMYGGGAIGGVINVILRKDYRGRELTLSAGTSTGGGSTEWSGSYMHGFSAFNGRTNGTLTLSYRNRGPLNFAQRTALLDRAVARSTVESQIGTFTQMPGVIRMSTATGDLGIPGAPGVRYATIPTGTTDAQANALTPASFAATAGKFALTYDRHQDNYIYTPSQMLSLGVTAEHSLIRDRLTLYSEVTVSRNLQDIHNPKFFGTGTSYTMSATHPFNPFRTGVTPGFVGRSVVLNVLPVDLRDSQTDMQRDSYRAVLGLKGKFGERWDWTLDGTTELNTVEGDSQVGADNIILASVYGTTTNAATFAQRWALYNLLVDHRANPAPASVNDEYFNAVGRQRYWQYASNLIARTTGDLYDWRAGTIKASLGGELYWWQYEGKRPYEIAPKLIALMGGRDNLSRDILFTKQGRRTDSVFGELTVPVVSKKWRPIPIEALDLNFSARHESANDSKSATTAASAVKLALTRDIALRASYTEGFFPPEQSNLHLSDYTFSTTISNTFTFVDPRRGNVAVTAPLTNSAGPNPDLNPETSTSENFGLILTPRFVKGLRLSLDYWNTRKIDAIRTPTLQQLLDNEAFFPDRVNRGPKLSTDPASWAGPVTGVDTRFINFAEIETDGFDGQVAYPLRLETLGEFTFRVNATFTNKFLTTITPVTPSINTVETTTGGLKWRGRSSIFWNRGDWTVGTTARYTHSYKTGTTIASTQFPSGTGADGERINSDLVWDLQVAYKIPYSNVAQGWRKWTMGTQWTLNVQNIFDRMPPWNSSGLYSRYSDPRMRYVSLSVKKSL